MRRRGAEGLQVVSDKYRYWRKIPVVTLDGQDRKSVTVMTGRRLWGTKEPVSHLKTRIVEQISDGPVERLQSNVDLASDGLRRYANEEAIRTINVDTGLLVTGIVLSALYDYDVNTLLGLVALGAARSIQIGLRRRSFNKVAQGLEG